MIQLTDTVKHLIIINVLFFVTTLIFKDDSMYDLLSIHFPMNDLFKPWQYVSHIFMHGGFQHLLFNMLGLWMFGSSVEQLIGQQKFLFLYFSAGIGAALFSTGIDYIQFNYLFNNLIDWGVTNIELNKILKINTNDSGIFIDKVNSILRNNTQLKEVNSDFVNNIFKISRIQNTSGVGASGAIYGIMVALAVLMPKTKMGMMFIPIQVEARYFIPLILLGDIFLGVFRQAGDNTGHFAHVGGAIVGFIILWYWKQNKFKF